MSAGGQNYRGRPRNGQFGRPARRNADARHLELTDPEAALLYRETQRKRERKSEPAENYTPQWLDIPENILAGDNSEALKDYQKAILQVAEAQANPEESLTFSSRCKRAASKLKEETDQAHTPVPSNRPLAQHRARRPAMSGSGNKFTFGQAGGASSGGSGGNLFGAGNTSQVPASSSGSLFGNNNATSGTGSGSLFGSAGNAAPSNTGSASGTSSTNPFGALSTPANTGTQQKPLFGAAPAGGQNLFGGASSGTSTGFGISNANQASTASPTTTTPTAAPASSQPASIFANAAANSTANAAPSTASWGFGGLSNSTPSTTAASSGTSLFGTANNQAIPATSGSNLFGSITNATPASSGSSLFPPQQPSGGTSLFGSSTAQTAPAQTASKPLFGSSTPSTSAPAASSNLFSGLTAGSTTPQPARPSPLNFSTTPAGNPPASASIFSTQQANTQAAAPAATTATSSALSFGFNNNASSGSNTTAATTTSAPGRSLFAELGQSQAAAPQASSASGSSLFPPSNSQASSGSTAAPASSSGGLFGQTAPSTSDAAPRLSLFSNLGQISSASAAPSGPSLFSNLGAATSSSSAQPAATTASAGTSLFSTGGLGAASSSSQPAATTATSSAAPLFGATATTSSAPTTSAAATSTAPATAAGAFTASTTGPAPPSTSRLAQKSMDEILTMWSTSLGQHQKTFQQLATQVSKWDRQLVENSGKISSLYGHCFQAERDCTEVERQLSLVEHGQVELEAALERYEAQVDRMIESSGGDDGAHGGVEGERERTYKTAEACSTRLTEMSHSLTDMIEEINLASGKLHNTNGNNQSAAGSSTRQDDPLAQIVRVLNGHLTQLQAIDEGAKDLGTKVARAQQEVKALGQSQGINGGGWIEGFGRSYLGRS